MFRVFQAWRLLRVIQRQWVYLKNLRPYNLFFKARMAMRFFRPLEKGALASGEPLARGRYIKEAAVLVRALQLSIRKIIVFFGAVLALVLILGSLLYMIEGEENGFTSIPQSIYWAIVTITTVGYGDLAPATVLGKILASVAMLTGYSIIAVPTGIITIEMGKAVKLEQKRPKKFTCSHCSCEDHDKDALFCKICGTKL